MKKILLLLIMVIAITGCDIVSVKHKNDIKDTSIDELSVILKNNNYIVVDVRTKEEYLSSHVKNSINIPYDEINEDIDLDKTKTIMVYCKSGVRSKKAYDTLKSLGFNVYDLGAYESVTLEKE